MSIVPFIGGLINTVRMYDSMYSIQNNNQQRQQLTNDVSFGTRSMADIYNMDKALAIDSIRAKTAYESALLIEESRLNNKKRQVDNPDMTVF